MKASRIVKLNEPLQVQELQTPTPKGTQVLVKIQSSGVCHSDVHVWEGYYEGIGGQVLKTTDRGVKYPLTPGHEIAGIVDSLGEQVEGFSKNEKVLVYPWIGEGMCPACKIGEENLCDKPRSLGIYNDGGYSEYVLVPDYKYLVKLGVAKKEGADVIVNSKKEDPTKAVMELTDKLGADAVIDFVNASKTVESDMQFLRRRARLVLVGLFGGELRLSLVTMPTRAYKVIGSYTGSLKDMVELVSLAERGVIKPVVSNRFKLDRAGEALQRLKDGKVVGRGVINP